MSLLILSILTGLAWMVWSSYTLSVHYRRARSLEIPILISPVGQSNIVWLLVQDFVAGYIARLPFGLGSWTRYNRLSWGWMFVDRGRIHQEYGPIIAHVTPAELQLWIRDKDIIAELLKGKDRAIFDKPREDVKLIDFIGPHLITAEGDTWKRHRRIVASPFTQRNNRLVWAESLHQGCVLAEHWAKDSRHGVRTVWEDCETVAMNVMVTAGFGLPREEQQDLGRKSTGSFNLHSSLSYMMTNFVWVILIPGWLWFPKYIPPYPASLRNFFISVRVFKEHLSRMVDESKNLARTAEKSNAITTTTRPSDNLLTALVRHSEELRHESQPSPPPPSSPSTIPTYRASYLTDNEVYSNLWGLAFAGHETVAHTLAYTMFLLAVHPDVQAWATEEIDAAFGGETLPALDSAWPLLPRTRALMHETLRMFAPVPNVLKQNLSSEPVTVSVGGRGLTIPAKAYVLPSLWALHSAQEYWGDDAAEWNPRRWVVRDEEGGGERAGRETFAQPSPPGAFLAWSDGPRSCPGVRFSQVEFVAICAAMLRGFRIGAVELEGEDEGAAAGRVKGVLFDSAMVVTLMVRHPEKIALRLKRRDERADA